MFSPCIACGKRFACDPGLECVICFSCLDILEGSDKHNVVIFTLDDEQRTGRVQCDMNGPTAEKIKSALRYKGCPQCGQLHNVS